MASRNPHSRAYITTDLFLNVSFPKSGYSTRGPCALTTVGDVYKCMFHNFKVKPWPDFNKNACKVLTGRNAKRIAESHAKRIQDMQIMSNALPTFPGETSLMQDFRTTCLNPTNYLLNDVEGPELLWQPRQHLSTGSHLSGKVPDFVFQSTEAGSSSHTRARRPTPVVGEMKKPCYSLGSRFTPDALTRRIQHRDYLDDVQLNPFYQALSYAIYSQKGVAVLSNFDENRYFKVNIRSREIWMSDLVKIDQRLNQRAEIPHAMQAMLYMREIEVPDKKEFSASLVEGLLTRGEQVLEMEAHEKEEEEKKKKSSSSRAGGAGSSKDHSRPGKPKKKRNNLFPPVSLVLRRCKVIGLLGEGVTGDVNEYDYDGQRVAVKIGSKHSSKDRDCVQHVGNEIEIYKRLKDLQGSVIPRVIESGLDTAYSAGIVLITEKVGMQVEDTEREITVGGKALDRENLVLFKRKGLEGLRKLRARGVVHGDMVTRNMRVEMRDGKVYRVCWVDFGDARVVDARGRRIQEADSENSGDIEAKSEESEESEDLEYLEEMIETGDTERFDLFVDRFISYTDG